MIKAIRLNAEDIIQLETNSCIPLATSGDKLLTVTSDSIYIVSIDGKQIYGGKKLHDAVDVYNMGSLPKKRVEIYDVKMPLIKLENRRIIH